MLQLQNSEIQDYFACKVGRACRSLPPPVLHSTLAVSRAERATAEQGTDHTASREILLATTSEATAQLASVRNR